MAPPVNETQEDKASRFTRTMNAMSQSFAIQSATVHVPFFNSKNIPLRQFIQDVENGLSLLAEGQEAKFVANIKSKLQGSARDSIEGVQDLDTVKKLTAELKKYFAPGRKYIDYVSELQSVRMHRDEEITEFYLRVKKILTSAQADLKSEYGAGNENSPILRDIAITSFIQGLRDDLADGVTLSNPTTLYGAYDSAIKLDRQIRDRSRHPQSGHSARYVRQEDPPQP